MSAGGSLRTRVVKYIFIAIFVIIIALLSSTESRTIHIIRFDRYRRPATVGLPYRECGHLLLHKCSRIARKCHMSMLSKRSIPDGIADKPKRRHKRARGRRHKIRKRVHLNCGKCKQACW